MPHNLGKSFSPIPVFDPSGGTVIRSPLGSGRGWWAGAPCATFDSITNTFFLVYRLRQPRELGRGVECRIAASDNGIAFTDIWALPKTNLSALSIERTCLTRGLDGLWRLYISHVDPTDRRWRISMLEAREPDQFDAQSMTTLLTAEDVGGEGVKDPNVFTIGRAHYMLASYATRETPGTPESEAEKHASGDIYNTGLTLSRTGAAVSGDGRNFQWIGDISPVGSNSGGPNADGWDRYCQRIGALVGMESGGYLAYYDGSASVEENYEEKTGLAVTFDMKTYYSLSTSGPSLVSPHGSGSLRYIDVLAVGHELFYYYEISKPDGSHEMRVSVVEQDS
jgi:hypothetical protein